MPRDEGVRDLVIAWTLETVSLYRMVSSQNGGERSIPMKCACKDQQVVDGDFVKSAVEVAIVD